MHSINPMIPFTPGDLRLNATIRHELIIETLVTLARGNRGNPATPRNLPRGIGVQVGKVRVHGMDAVVMRDLGLGAIRQKLSIHLAAADHPRYGLVSNRSKRFVNAMHHVNALGSKAIVARKHDIAAVLERTPTGKTQQGLASHNNRAPFGTRHKMAHVGAIFRSAAALNVDGILVSPTCCDPLYRRSARVSMGTVFQVPWTRIGSEARVWPHDGLAALHDAGFSCAAMALTDDSVSLDDPALQEIPRLAIFMGTEGAGLGAKTIAGCDRAVRIPMAHGVDSLNVAAASAVAFWQLCPHVSNEYHYQPGLYH